MDNFLQEGQRQGEEYSRKIIHERSKFFGDKHWEYTRRYRAGWMLHKIRKSNPDLNNMKVLEVGCGTGFTAFEVATSDLVKEIVAIDMSVEALKVARQQQNDYPGKSAGKIVFKHGNFFDEDEKRKYDCIYMHQVFEHMPESTAVFYKAERLLCPKGFLMISTPNYDRFFNRMLSLFGKKRTLIDPYFHIKEYTYREIAAAPKKWKVVSITAKSLLDEFVLCNILSLGIRKIKKRILPMCRRLTANRTVYSLGSLFPRVSSDILVLYKKEAITP